MTLKESISKHFVKGKDKEAAPSETTPLSEDTSPASSRTTDNDGTTAVTVTATPAASSATSATSQAEAALHKLQADDDKHGYLPDANDGRQSPVPGNRTSLDVPVSATTSASLSRNASTSSAITKYKAKLMNTLPIGQFDIENATAVPLNISLNHVGPLYYDTVKPGDVFSRSTGKVWFTIEVRVHTGPASEYNSWSVAWPIMLVAGPSAAAISLAAIPIAALVAGTTSISALVAVAVEGVSAAVSSAASALGIASRLPFASKYKTKAISAAKGQAVEAQKLAGTVMENLRAKGGVQGFIDDLKKRGGEPKIIEWSETPSSVHDITDADLADVFDTDGSGPKGWKKKRWQSLRSALLDCKLVDRGWYAGREPILRVTGGPKVVHVSNPLPKHKDEQRTILEIWPLRLEKVVIEDGVALAEEVAVGEGSDSKGTKQVVTEAAEAMRE